MEVAEFLGVEPLRTESSRLGESVPVVVVCLIGPVAVLQSLWARSGTKPGLVLSYLCSVLVAVVATLPLAMTFRVLGLELLRLVLTVT